ncbi:hypothetical protein B7486_11385 [cyanobacterium TDX16]|nr:hypothetical protein B7486_11385 [cyanobacterium TDX16]
MAGCLALSALCATTASLRAQALNEGFNDITTLVGAGWVMQNLSQATGTSGWSQGDNNVFAAHAGPLPSSYISANFENAGDGAGQDTISNWLMSPVRTFNNGDTISFWAQSATAAGIPQFADRLQLRLSTGGASVNVGATATSVGDFTMLLRDINSTYGQGADTYVLDNQWLQFNVTLTGIPAPNTMGRFAFRYFVENGGPNGLRSNYIGIDTVSYTPVPEPATLALLAGSLLLVRRRRRSI